MSNEGSSSSNETTGSSTGVTAGSGGASESSSGSAGSGAPTGYGGTAGGTGTAGSDSRDSGRDGEPFVSSIDPNMSTDVSGLGGKSCGGIEYPKAAFYGENFLYQPYAEVARG